MEEYGELLGPDAVRFVRLLPGPIERVWRYLADADKRARWLCGGETEPKVGGHVDMEFDNSRLSGPNDDPRPEKYAQFDGPVTFSGTVTRYDPPRLLAHTWDFEGESSEVCYELSAEDDKVRLVLTHTRLNSNEEVRDVCAGWHSHLGILSDVLEDRSPRPFWRTHTALEADYGARIGG